MRTEAAEFPKPYPRYNTDTSYRPPADNLNQQPYNPQQQRVYQQPMYTQTVASAQPHLTSLQQSQVTMVPTVPSNAIQVPYVAVGQDNDTLLIPVSSMTQVGMQGQYVIVPSQMVAGTAVSQPDNTGSVQNQQPLQSQQPVQTPPHIQQSVIQKAHRRKRPTVAERFSAQANPQTMSNMPQSQANTAVSNTPTQYRTIRPAPTGNQQQVNALVNQFPNINVASSMTPVQQNIPVSSNIMAGGQLTSVIDSQNADVNVDFSGMTNEEISTFVDEVMAESQNSNIDETPYSQAQDPLAQVMQISGVPSDLSPGHMNYPQVQQQFPAVSGLSSVGNTNWVSTSNTVTMGNNYNYTAQQQPTYQTSSQLPHPQSYQQLQQPVTSGKLDTHQRVTPPQYGNQPTAQHANPSAPRPALRIPTATTIPTTHVDLNRFGNSTDRFY